MYEHGCGNSSGVIATKSCLVLLAHGSKDPRWREPFETLFAKVRANATRVKLAYMEFVSPTLQEVAEQCIREQLMHLRVLPMFMASGAHLATDVPAQVEQLQDEFPELQIKVLPPIGEDPRIISLMEQVVLEKAG